MRLSPLLLAIALASGSALVKGHKKRAGVTTTSRALPTTTTARATTTTPPSSTSPSTLPAPLSNVKATVSPVSAIECPAVQARPPPSSQLTPINSGLSLGTTNVLGEILVETPKAGLIVLGTTSDRITFRNGTTGDWGVLSDGTLFFTPANCSRTDKFDFQELSKGKMRKGRAATDNTKRVVTVDDTVDIDITVHMADGSAIKSDCDFALLAQCHDFDTPAFNDVVDLRTVGPNQYDGSCSFKKADVAADCIDSISSVISVITGGQNTFNNVNNILDIGSVDGLCATVAIATGVVSGAILTPAEAAFLSSCIAAMDALQSLVHAGLKQIGPEAVCKTMGKDNPDGLYEINVYNVAVSGSPLIFASTITGITPTDILTGLLIDSSQAGCPSTTTTTTRTTTISTTSKTTTASQTSSTPRETCGLPIARFCDPTIDCCASGLVCADSLCVPQCDEGTTVNCDPIPTRCQQECGATSTATV